MEKNLFKDIIRNIENINWCQSQKDICQKYGIKIETLERYLDDLIYDEYVKINFRNNGENCSLISSYTVTEKGLNLIK